MKKILIISSTVISPIHSIAFAIKTAKEISGELHCIFFNGSISPAGLRYPFPNDMASTEVPLTEESIKEENTGLPDSYIKLFKDECLAFGIACKVSTTLTLDEVLELSTSSDLIIVQANDDFPQFSLKDILTSSYCPVFVVGSNTPVIDTVILTFDGEEPSKYAIKKYKDLFPHFCHLPTFLIIINFSTLKILEHKEFIYNWLPRYFSNIIIEESEGDKKEELRDFLNFHDSNTLIVMGAFSRSAVSRLFHPSLANTVLYEGRVSLFNAHE